jgi:glyoxylase-like metal-dependent hydrolase (beta-lactamase superfamily II)
MNHPAPGVSTITLPMPWELETVNVHLVELDEGFLLVDSGIATEECFDSLESALNQAGIAWSDIRTLCLTHLHPDHIGLSWKILELSGARMVMHRVEAEYLALVALESRAPFFDQAMLNAGVPEEMQGRMDRALRDVRRNYRTHQPDQVLEGGERIPVRGGTLEAVWTPGHSPGHVCLYSPEHRYLISGDHILEFITPNIGWHPNTDMLAQYLDSLELLDPFDVDLILPSHGGPFRGHRERIRATTDHHAERCGQILAHIAREPLTAHGLVAQVWPRTLSPFHHHFAVFEILAHLEYLQRRGQVAAESRNGGALYWRPIAGHQ